MFEDKKNGLFPKCREKVNFDDLLKIIMKNPGVNKEVILNDYNSAHSNNKITHYQLNTILKLYHLSKKSIKPKNKYTLLQRWKNQKFIFISYLISVIKNNFTIIFIDESCFKPMSKYKAWVHKNDYNKNAKVVKNCSSIKHYQLILACTFNGIIFTKLTTENNNTEMFCQFLKDLIATLDVDKSKTIVYLDNVNIHKTAQVQNIIMASGMRLIYGVPYYPDYDLCEEYFMILKSRLSSVNPVSK